jgi:hypothetical protein
MNGIDSTAEYAIRSPVPEQQQRDADQPVDVARLAERAGEEDADGVERDRADERDRRPVMDLPHHEPRSHLERDAQHRVVGLRDRLSVQRRVRAAIGGLVRRRDVEEREERPREDEDQEAVHRDLAEHERPVVREHLAQAPLGEARRMEPFVEALDHVADDHGMFQKLGPTGPLNPPPATR